MNAQGLYCAEGGFYIDPWGAVERAVITHAHADHVRPGAAHYLTAASGAPLARERLGPRAHVQAVPYGRSLTMGRVKVSLHPAGHLLGSAQVRVESARGEVWVVSGDYKTQPDRTCEPFELVPCHTFVTESTFGLPIYRWPPEERVFDEIGAWWRENQRQGRTSILFAYALGKAQRVLGGVDPSIGPILVHGTVARFLPAYKAAGIALPTVQRAEGEFPEDLRRRALVIAPPRHDVCAVDEAVRSLLDRFRFGLDATSRHAAPTWDGSRFRPFRPRRLGFPDIDGARHRCRAGAGHARLCRVGGALAVRTGY